MATHAELFGLMDNSVLRNNVSVCVGVWAETIWQEAPETPNHANRLVWARRAYSQPVTVARECLWAVIIANREYEVAQILAADDESILANVGDVVDMFATG